MMRPDFHLDIMFTLLITDIWHSRCICRRSGRLRLALLRFGILGVFYLALRGCEISKAYVPLEQCLINVEGRKCDNVMPSLVANRAADTPTSLLRHFALYVQQQSAATCMQLTYIARYALLDAHVKSNVDPMYLYLVFSAWQLFSNACKIHQAAQHHKYFVFLRRI